ncbi:MAG: alpha/beta hydrolase [Actinotalea sp.]|nr:alpha/beta hydrolase [Actinotalea sp.]
MDTLHLTVPGGTLAVTVQGDGPLVVLSPGMGDLAAVFRDVVPAVVAAGYRAATVDLRGHGASATTFAEHGLRATAADLLAVVRGLGQGPAVLVGHSVSAGAAVLAAVEAPDLVRGLALLSLHLPGDPPGRVAHLMTRVQVAALAGPWAPSAWAAVYRSLHRGRTAPWADGHVTDVRDALRDAGRRRALHRLARSLVTEEVGIPLERVTVPAVVVHGALDPEFPDPAAELRRALDRLGGTRAAGLLVPEAGHYPHSQRADVVGPAVVDLLAVVAEGAGA